jgi:hypothetical protein
VAIAWVVRSLPQAARLPIAAVLLGSTLLLDLSALGLVAARFYG